MSHLHFLTRTYSASSSLPSHNIVIFSIVVSSAAQHLQTLFPMTRLFIFTNEDSYESQPPEHFSLGNIVFDMHLPSGVLIWAGLSLTTSHFSVGSLIVHEFKILVYHILLDSPKTNIFLTLGLIANTATFIWFWFVPVVNVLIIRLLKT